MWKKNIILLGFISLVFIITIGFSLTKTFQKLASGNVINASITANNLSVVTNIASTLSFKKINGIEFLNHSLQFVGSLPQHIDSLKTAGNINSNENYIFDISKLKDSIKNIYSQVIAISSSANKSFLAKKILGEDKISQLNLLSDVLNDVIIVLDSVSTKDQKILVVFQNSDEIRATGGFMGSYAIVDIQDGKIVEIVIEDIYDADGQFEGYVEAPKGVKEYLSSNQGLRLPNANWSPDFPSSSEQILQFFALGNRKNITTLIAVNLDYAKILLNIMGDVTLSDYNTIINSENINEVLRSRRSAFFPGSRQKKHLLSQLVTQLEIKFSDLDTDKKVELLKKTHQQIVLNNIQLYSVVDKVDHVFSKYNLRQEIEYQPDAEYLYLIESNVGINKANKEVFREVSINLKENIASIAVKFINNNYPPTESILTELIEQEEVNDSDHLGYINYQRILVRPDWSLKSISYAGQNIESWNEQIIKNKNDQEFKEIGFLISLKEQSEESLILEFESVDTLKNKLYLQKQPGISPTSVSIKHNDFYAQVILENDQLFETN